MRYTASHKPIFNEKEKGCSIMSELVPTGSKYTDNQRKDAATQYAITGTLSSIVKDTGIPQQTLSSWKQTDWWDSLVSEVRSAKQDEHIAKYTELVDAAQKITLAKLPEATAQQASIIAATATDKARLLMNQPTSISAKSDSINDLAKQFKALSDSFEEKQVSVVSIQAKDEAP